MNAFGFHYYYIQFIIGINRKRTIGFGHVRSGAPFIATSVQRIDCKDEENIEKFAAHSIQVR